MIKKDIALFTFFWLILVAIFQIIKPMPPGTDFISQTRYADVEFLCDISISESSDQEIFDTVFNYINKADKYILLDMFLFNPHDGSSRHSNVAFKVNGMMAADIYETEKAVAVFSRERTAYCRYFYFK